MNPVLSPQQSAKNTKREPQMNADGRGSGSTGDSRVRFVDPPNAINKLNCRQEAPIGAKGDTNFTNSHQLNGCKADREYSRVGSRGGSHLG